MAQVFVNNYITQDQFLFPITVTFYVLLCYQISDTNTEANHKYPTFPGLNRNSPELNQSFYFPIKTNSSRYSSKAPELGKNFSFPNQTNASRYSSKAVD